MQEISNSGHPTQSWHGTTILAVVRSGRVVLAGDGQVSLGSTVIKSKACKVRRLAQGSVLAGFAGATADAFTLLERLEIKLEQHRKQLRRAAISLAKDWRTDRFLRRLEAMMIVADAEHLFLLTGLGDVLEPDEPVCAIGSGGPYAYSAAKALIENTELDAEEIARRSMEIAANICVYTNYSLSVESLERPE